METLNLPPIHLEDVPKIVWELRNDLKDIHSLLSRMLGQSDNIDDKIVGYMTTKDAVEYFGKDENWIRRQCSNRKIKGATKMGKDWMIPKNAELI